MQLTLTLPDHIYDLLSHSHSKGAEAAAMVALKRYLKSLPTTTNADRDLEIADKAVHGTPLKTLAKAYGLSYIRIQQIVSKGRAAAYARQADKIKQDVQAMFAKP
jgi:hypothetical protein